MRCGLLFLTCVFLTACGKAVDPASLRTATLLPDGQPIELAIGAGGAVGDADHATIASAPNGDVLVAFQVKQAKADSAEVHAVYFRYLGPEKHAWEPSPTLVLAQKDASGRGCGKPDVIACPSSPMPGGDAAFAVVWARRSSGEHLGSLEAALVRGPEQAGGPALRLHSDGQAGFVLDDALDTEIATATPDLARSGLWIDGHFGVVYTHRAQDSGDAAVVRLRWREARLPSDGSAPELLHASDLVAEVPVHGTLYQYPGGVVIPDAVIVDAASPQLLVAYGESTSDREGSHLVLARFLLTEQASPQLDQVVALEPPLAQGQAYLRRPNLEVLQEGAVLLVADAVAARPSKQRVTQVFRINSADLAVTPWSWPSVGAGQESPIAIADTEQIGVFFHERGQLGYGLAQQNADGGAALPAIEMGSEPLGQGRQPHLAGLPGTTTRESVLFMSTFAPSERERKVRRVSLRAWTGGLTKFK